MKSILVSIKPKWCEKIASGKKTIEVRKTAPKETPFKAYIYCCKAKSQWRYSDYEGAYENSKGEIVYAQQHVIGEFVCDKIYPIKNKCNSFVVANEEQGVTNEIARQSCLDYDDMVNYLGDKDGYGWHISDLKIYDKPEKLSEFFKPCPTKEKGDCLSCDCLADTDYGGICTNNLTRPPQSWCYVEGLGELL